MGKLSMIVGACVATSLLAAQANAGTVAMTLNSVNPKTTNLSISFDGGSTWKTNASVGEFNWTVATPAPTLAPTDPGYGALAVGSQITTFCIQGTQTVTIGQTYSYTLTGDVASAPIPGAGMGAAKAEALTEFWGKNFSLVGSSSINAAAFQLGVWEIVNDTQLDTPWSTVTTSIFTQGTFQIGSTFLSDAAVTLALTYLHKITGTYTPTTFELGALESGTSQDQIASFTPPVGAPAVPLPAALPVGGAMLGLMGVVAGIRKRKSRAADE